MTSRNPTLRGYLKGKHSTKTIFKFVRQKINEQGCPSIRHQSGACVYLGDHGIKCAAGHLISNKDIVRAMMLEESLNHSSIYTMMRSIGFSDEDTKSNKVSFIRELQQAHDEAAWNKDVLTPDSKYTINDNATFLKRFNENMDEIADDYDLYDL